jgi:hypothetical protein
MVMRHGEKMEQVIVYLGNNAFTGAAPAGPPFNVWMKVTNAAGQQVCGAADGQLDPIPSGKSWGAYTFQIVHPPPLPVGGRNPNNSEPTTSYEITAMISPEHYDADTKQSNNYAIQSFRFIAGGTASCHTSPRPTFH